MNPRARDALGRCLSISLARPDLIAMVKKYAASGQLYDRGMAAIALPVGPASPKSISAKRLRNRTVRRNANDAYDRPHAAGRHRGRGPARRPWQPVNNASLKGIATSTDG